MGITLKNVSYTYQAGTPFEGPALFGVDLEIKSGSYTALIGHTGSGKSTILQLLNGLLVPNQGSVEIGSTVITADSVNKDIKQVRKKVGLVFQFPESQVFDETVLKDVAFGPQNFGVSKEEAEVLAREKLHLVGISEDLFNRSPFELSGGQMRRVAIAGILAMEPDILVLDEPTELHRAGMTIVLVTHLMDDVANFADTVYVLDKGRVVKSGQPAQVFQDLDFMESIQLGVPKITKFAHELAEKGMTFSHYPITIEEFKELLHG